MGAIDSALVRRHVWLHGTVQGVGYRWSTRQQAQALGLNGWVRNLPDGRVEAVFEGSEQQISRMMAWCQIGPPAAAVEQMDQVDHEPVEGIQGFRVI